MTNYEKFIKEQDERFKQERALDMLNNCNENRLNEIEGIAYTALLGGEF